jgi:hypothetical protein
MEISHKQRQIRREKKSGPLIIYLLVDACLIIIVNLRILGLLSFRLLALSVPLGFIWGKLRAKIQTLGETQFLGLGGFNICKRFLCM